MKRRFQWALVLSVLVGAVPVGAEPTVRFTNFDPANGIDAPVTNHVTGLRLSGAPFWAQLYYGPAGSPETGLVAIGSVTPFLTGGLAGYFNDGTRTLPGVTEGALATFQVRVWQNSFGLTYEEAVMNPLAIYGKSLVFETVTGGAGTPFNGPAPLTGLMGFTTVPEPSPPVMMGAGLALGWLILLLQRRVRLAAALRPIPIAPSRPRSGCNRSSQTR
jgi:hypothetical protein